MNGKIKMTPVREITIGADPEFLLIDETRNIVKARQFQLFESCDENSKIGCDGQGTPVEIRTDPVLLTDVESLCDDVSHVFRRISEFCNRRKLGLYAGASFKGKQPIGGHIHFGGEQFKGYHKAGDKLVQLMDVYFTPITNFFIHEENIWRRSGGNYGQLNESRDQKWGLEYRTPYSFLISPFLTKAFYSLASLVAHNYKKLPFERATHQLMFEYYDIGMTKRSLLWKVYKRTKPIILKAMSYSSPNPKTNSHILSLFNIIEQNKEATSLNVTKNYGYENFLFKPIKQFDITPTNENKVRMIADMLYDDWRYNSNRETNIQLLMYGIETNEDDYYDIDRNGIYEIYLSEAMPELKIKTNKKIKVKIQTSKRVERWKYSMGLSYKLRKAISNQGYCVDELKKYINKIDIIDEEEYV